MIVRERLKMTREWIVTETRMTRMRGPSRLGVQEVSGVGTLVCSSFLKCGPSMIFNEDDDQYF